MSIEKNVQTVKNFLAALGRRDKRSYSNRAFARVGQSDHRLLDGWSRNNGRKAVPVCLSCRQILG